MNYLNSDPNTCLNMKVTKLLKFCCLTGGFMHGIKVIYTINWNIHKKYFIPQEMYNLIEITPRLTIFQQNKSPCRV